MFFLPQTILAWVASVWLIRWRQLPFLLVYGLAGSVISDLEDTIGHAFGLWTYTDKGPISSHNGISVLIGLGAAPLCAFFFAQHLPKSGRFPWALTAFLTMVCLIPEVTGLYTGNLIYSSWWNVAWSVVAYLPTWTILWLLYRWLDGPWAVPKNR